MLDNFDSKENANLMKNVGKIIGAIIVLILFFSCFYIINAGERGVMLTLGSPSMTALKEGIGFKVPFIQDVKIMEVRTQKYEAEASAASKDLQTVSAKIATNYHLLPEKVPEIYRDIGLSYAERIIQPMEQEVVKATTAKFTAEELVTKREEVRNEMKALFTERLINKGIIVEELSIINFDFSPSFNNAIEQKVTSAQLKLKAEMDLQRIEVEAKQVEAKAIGEKNAKIASAEGDARAVEIINEQLKKSPQYIEYYKLQRWDGKLSQVVGSSMPMIELNK